ASHIFITTLAVFLCSLIVLKATREERYPWLIAIAFLVGGYGMVILRTRGGDDHIVMFVISLWITLATALLFAGEVVEQQIQLKTYN
ncbi:MAG: hypothetical protein ABEI77_09225, partial [Halorientalis sp.]